MSVIVYIGSLFAIIELKIVDPELNSHTLRALENKKYISKMTIKIRAYLNTFKFLKVIKGNDSLNFSIS